MSEYYDFIEHQGRRDKDGYGLIWKDGGQRRAHRLAWEAAKGPIPEGLLVLHHCDNPPCINPDHLFLGTQSDNIRDAHAKGRAAGFKRGPEHWCVRLTAEAIPEIRQRLASGESQRSVARSFGVSQGAIRGILIGRTWRHV